jgi:hypothetical protein
MKSKSPFWIWLTMALLALSVTAFVATRPLSAFAQSATPKVGNKQQAARSDKTPAPNGLHAGWNSQGDQTLGRRLRGRDRA